MTMKIKCEVCGKEFDPGNRVDGMPNGITFVATDGKPLTMCADCIIEMGRLLEGHGLIEDSSPFAKVVRKLR